MNAHALVRARVDSDGGLSVIESISCGRTGWRDPRSLARLVRLARALQPGKRLSEFSNRRGLRLTPRLTRERLRRQSDR